MADSHDFDLLNIFWVEVGDYLQNLNRALLQTEAATAPDPEVLREMNRLAHSMKGAARAVGITVIETIAYYLEEIFEGALRNRIALEPGVCDLLYDALDLIQNVVNGGESNADHLGSTVARLQQIIAESAPESPSKTDAAEHQAVITTQTITLKQDEYATIPIPAAEDSVRVPVSRMDQLMGEISELLVARMHSEERAMDFEKLQKFNRRWQREWRSVRAAYIRLARRLQHHPHSLPEEVLTIFHFLEENQRYLQDSNRQLTQLSRSLAQFNNSLAMLTEQLQEDISGLRLVPFETLIPGFQRLVRDLARDTGKEVHLEVSGASVEMDKTALDALKEPIMHLLRNAIDHGLETPDQRLRAGKLALGMVTIAVEQRGKEILIRISDDGYGLDAARLTQTAVDARIITPQQATLLTLDEAHNLIFYPGLSTNDEVTSLSGRGIGMDIVRTRVESLRGQVQVESTPRRNTTVLLRIPMSLTRLSCIVLRAGDQHFAVPSVSVTRMIKAHPDSLFAAEGREMIHVGGSPLPVIPLAPVLGGEATPRGTEIVLMVLASGERSVAFEVDELYSEEELVLKPLGPEIADIPIVSGGALLGSGDVLIVLDPNGLIRGAVGTPAPRVAREQDDTQPAEERKQRVLVVDDSITTRTLEKRILETIGFEVRVAVDGQDGWEKLREFNPDVVIADVEMPRMNGLELCRLIKETSETNRIPVIMLTSLAKPEQREAGLKAGADAYLVKSKFDQNELLQVIRSVM
jgi:two-component system chemotaxis sensor kinase CheA